MKVLTASEILNAPDLKSVEEPCPEWGEDSVVVLRELSAGDCMAMNDDVDAQPKNGMFLVVIHCAFDSDGNRLFPLPEGKDERAAKLDEYVKALKQKSIRVLNRLQLAALDVNSMRPRQRGDLKKD